jgi:hypothetical protein
MAKNKMIILISTLTVVICGLFLIVREINKFPWRSYADEKLSYELKYPPTWSIADERQGSGMDLAWVVFQSKDYQEIESEEYKRIVAAGE